MASSSSATPGSSGKRLLLRCLLSGRPVDEIYLARKLSIGRAIDNTIVIDDPTVDRHHAVVQLDDTGRFVLECVAPTARIETAGGPVASLPLAAGAEFRIGSGQFQCVDAGAEKAPSAARWRVCPHCGHDQLPPPAERPQTCPSCQQPILIIALGEPGERLVLRTVCHQIQAVRVAGRGGMAVVLQAQVLSDQRRVAVKIMLPTLADDPDAQARFRREIAVMQQIRHPSVVRILGCGRWDRLPCLVLAWVEGQTLREVIRQNRARRVGCAFQPALRWMIQVAEGLRAIHAAGLVHRDLKPSNILIDRGENAYVADLGVVRRMLGDMTAMTTTGTAVGTWEYMAPEQLDPSQMVDGRADLYSLGVTFYELLTGELPRGKWPLASQINPTVPPEFDDLDVKLQMQQV